MQQVRMHYSSGTDGCCCIDASCSLIRWQHFVAWNGVTADILKAWRRRSNRKSNSVNR